MKIKTSELKGVALDWAVAKCAVHLYDGQEHCIVIVNNGEVRFFKSAPINRPPCQSAWSCPLKYSTDWAQGGVIIEREGIELWCSLLGQPNHNDPAWQTSHWRAKYYNRGVGDNVLFDGKTPLEAAMRCYVASKLGDEVEIPNELTEEK